ncbi:hypothetical protein Rhal01_01576 [Rubritalea halochordaticola]|uniref:Nucleotide-diphospho-sugar transferase domain-containing protein n=1 Tax=Rubritalea halochordaticola TaxID=714537 RepID=A0ABP9UY81_9BACT
MGSVRSWADSNGWEYFLADDDALLASLPEHFKMKVGERWPMLVDLGRLKLCQQAILDGCERVIWLDADVLVIEPERLRLPESLDYGYAFGREVWVEESRRVRRGIHNALCVFEPGNAFLDFYAHSCERIIEVHEGDQLAPQLLGPKLLKALDAFTKMQLIDEVGMASPWVVEDIVAGGGKRLDCLKEVVGEIPPALNLCSSMLSDELGNSLVEMVKSGAYQDVL